MRTLAGRAGLPGSVSAFSLAGTAPPFDNATTGTAGGTLGRWVFGSINVQLQAADDCRYIINIEDGVASSNFVPAIKGGVTIRDATNPIVHTPFCFFVPTGRRYRFQAFGGAPMAFDAYSYADI